MPQKIDDARKVEILRRYGMGDSPTKIARELGVSPSTVHGLSKEAGLTRGQTLVAASQAGIDPHLFGATTQVAVPPPVAQPSSTAQPVGPPPAPIAPQSIGTCPLFPTRKSHEIDRLIITRLEASPPMLRNRYGVGLIGEFSMDGDESLIRDLYGGGVYKIMAYNSRGDVLSQRTVRITGDSIALSPSQPTGDEGGEDAQAVNWFPQPQSGPNMTELVRVMQEATQAQIAQMDRNQQTMLQLVMQLQPKGVDFQTLLPLLVPLLSAHKPPTMEEQLRTLEMLKGLKGESESEGEQSAVVAAIKTLPEVIKGFGSFLPYMMQPGEDDDVEYEDEDEEDSEDEPEASPEAPPQAAKGPRDIRLVAKDLIDNLIAEGYPEAEAKQKVQMGLMWLANDAQKRKKPAPVVKNQATPRVTAGPASQPAPALPKIKIPSLPTVRPARAPTATQHHAVGPVPASPSNGKPAPEAVATVKPNGEEKSA